MRSDKRGAVVTNTVMGIGALIVGVIVTLVLVQTLINANLFEDGRLSTAYTGETTSTVVNETGVTFGNNTLSDARCSIDAVISNSTLIGSGNYTVTSASCNVVFSGTVTDGVSYNNTIWTINSTTTYDSVEETSVADLRTNYSTGIGNVSTKIPTILTIVAVVFLFGALVLLMKNARAMGVGGGGSL